MAKTVTYRVVNNRLMFRCTACQAKRMVALPNNIHRKNIRCHKCGVVTSCLLNRRRTLRESLAGKAVLIFSDGREVNVDFSDISPGGVSFDIPSGSKGISLGQEVRLKCTWNPRLLTEGSYVVRNIKGCRIGVESVGRKYAS